MNSYAGIFLFILSLLLFGVIVGGFAFSIIKTRNKKVRYLIGTHIGKRAIQQDSISILEPLDGNKVDCIALLSDGMSRLNYGEYASRYVVSQMSKKLLEMKDICKDIEALKKEVYSISYNLFQESLQKGPMGATLIICLIKKGYLYWLSVGDSRIFMLRNNELIQLNETHDYFNFLLEKVMAEETTKAEAVFDAQCQNITSYMGQKVLNQIDYNLQPYKLKKYDKLFICTDGITKSLSKEDIKSVLNNTESNNVVGSIIEKVINYNLPDQDNMSTVLIEYLGE
ncbi:serine/threonine protein phosphatase PrpC [Natranaerovirga pectinivora]|uniref:Serine/threonine protein phosphatase PrpC n=1 Tax=Natranaerovirga pectinivora TaxID=682400 RepID=A0A4R3MSW0_9FIRM|nr:PP2C family serine/threonine-protein phosphatase [Natranaerovirga pectinivora]TCT16124.1 serine/threonine protein phosphatase PrpC [Natranaerovirga pectinivora]